MRSSQAIERKRRIVVCLVALHANAREPGRSARSGRAVRRAGTTAPFRRPVVLRHARVAGGHDYKRVSAGAVGPAPTTSAIPCGGRWSRPGVLFAMTVCCAFTEWRSLRSKLEG